MQNNISKYYSKIGSLEKRRSPRWRTINLLTLPAVIVMDE